MIALAASLAGFWLCAALGALAAWLMRRRTTLSVRNLYVGAASSALVCAAIVFVRWWDGLLVAAPLAAAPIAGTLAGRRWRLADLGAGEELRKHELARRWAWQPPPRRRPGERVYIRSQGEIVHERPWPASEAYVPMTADLAGPKLPRGEGQHIFSCGGIGAGKTTSALRIVAARALADRSAVLAIDQKGDAQAERTLREVAAAAGCPFVLIDPRAADTDRWQPISGDVADVVARVVEPIKASEEYYSDMLRLYLGVVAHVLRADLPHNEPERIGGGERHACEIAVHPASSLEQLVQVESGAPTISKLTPAAQADRSDPPQLELPFDRRDGSR